MNDRASALAALEAARAKLTAAQARADGIRPSLFEWAKRIVRAGTPGEIAQFESGEITFNRLYDLVAAHDRQRRGKYQLHDRAALDAARADVGKEKARAAGIPDASYAAARYVLRYAAAGVIAQVEIGELSMRDVAEQLRIGAELERTPGVDPSIIVELAFVEHTLRELSRLSGLLRASPRCVREIATSRRVLVARDVAIALAIIRDPG